MKKIINLIFFCLLSAQVSFLMISEKVLADTNQQKIDIATSPEKVLFNLKNLKPGDWAARTLTVYNSGKKDYKYLVSMKKISGSDQFFNELLLQVTDGTKVLYNGRLKDFNKTNPRNLAKDQSDKLFFKVVVPENLGNEFQGLECTLQFKIYVEGTLGGLLPVNGAILPETGTFMYNFILTGASLIIIGLVLLLIRKRIEKKFKT